MNERPWQEGPGERRIFHEHLCQNRGVAAASKWQLYGFRTRGAICSAKRETAFGHFKRCMEDPPAKTTAGLARRCLWQTSLRQ